jgi:LPPG:FO 2-phospho-L-lactate transferase
MITILTGGTGGAKFVQGMAGIVDPREITVIVNTGDDLTWWGLHVSPDIDSVMYALASELSRERGWGVEGDTFECLARMKRLDALSWFQLGDRDLATHLRRTELMKEGATLSRATAELAAAFGVRTRILPMSDQRVETRVLTNTGDLSFQEYFVRERWKPEVNAVYFSGADKAVAAPGVVDAIRKASAVFLAPSNPITSIGPILAVPGIREALVEGLAPVIAVSPIIAGRAVSGPAGELMRSAGLCVSCAGVAEAYKDFVRVLIVDHADEEAIGEVEATGVHGCVAATMMYSEAEKLALARAALASAEQGLEKGA